MNKGQAELDPKKREETYRAIFNKANEERYSMPITPIPSVIAHTKDLKVPTTGTRKPEGFILNLLEWK